MNKTSKSLIGPIAIFILLDLSILLINFGIARHLEEDSVAINLAGRQRMLSQRITKTLLLMEYGSPDKYAAYDQELRKSAAMFSSVMNAFIQGGMVEGGDGNQVGLNPIESSEAKELVIKARALWEDIYQPISPYMANQTPFPSAVLHSASSEMVSRNAELLSLLNQYTTQTENASKNMVNRLRFIQTAVFMLALCNFLYIARKFFSRSKELEDLNGRLYITATTDSLTGAFNRRRFNDEFERELAKARRHGRKLAILMLDINDFKPVNDGYGHAVGDKLLQEVAARLMRFARSSDIVARIGGDEFAVICPETENEAAVLELIQRLMNKICQPVALEQTTLQVSVSIGHAVYPPDGDSMEKLLTHADSRMYLCKQEFKQKTRRASIAPECAPIN